MATRPTLHVAVAKKKNKASEYNENFNMMMDYCETVAAETTSYVDGFMPSISASTTNKFLTNNGTITSWGTVDMSGKADTNLTNAVPTSAFATALETAEIRTIVRVSEDDDLPRWYRVWSDGWCEQGGLVTDTGTSGTLEFNLSFTSTNYTIVCNNWIGITPVTASSDKGGLETTVAFSNATASSVRYDIAQHRSFSWYACGYVDLEELDEEE